MTKLVIEVDLDDPMYPNLGHAVACIESLLGAVKKRFDPATTGAALIEQRPANKAFTVICEAGAPDKPQDDGHMNARMVVVTAEFDRTSYARQQAEAHGAECSYEVARARVS